MFSCSELAPMCPDIVQLILAGRNVTIGCVDGSDLAKCVRTLGNNFWQAEMLESGISDPNVSRQCVIIFSRHECYNQVCRQFGFGQQCFNWVSRSYGLG